MYSVIVLSRNTNKPTKDYPAWLFAAGGSTRAEHVDAVAYASTMTKQYPAPTHRVVIAEIKEEVVPTTPPVEVRDFKL